MDPKGKENLQEVLEKEISKNKLRQIFKKVNPSAWDTETCSTLDSKFGEQPYLDISPAR